MFIRIFIQPDLLLARLSNFPMICQKVFPAFILCYIHLWTVLLCLCVMNQLTKNLACKWAKDNIHTNCVVPGATITIMLQPDASDLSGDNDTNDDGKDVGDKF